MDPLVAVTEAIPKDPYLLGGAALGVLLIVWLIFRSMRRKRLRKTDAMIFAAEQEVNIPPLKH